MSISNDQFDLAFRSVCDTVWDGCSVCIAETDFCTASTLWTEGTVRVPSCEDGAHGVARFTNSNFAQVLSRTAGVVAHSLMKQDFNGLPRGAAMVMLAGHAIRMHSALVVTRDRKRVHVAVAERAAAFALFDRDKTDIADAPFPHLEWVPNPTAAGAMLDALLDVMAKCGKHKELSLEEVRELVARRQDVPVETVRVEWLGDRIRAWITEPLSAEGGTALDRLVLDTEASELDK